MCFLPFTSGSVAAMVNVFVSALTFSSTCTLFLWLPLKVSLTTSRGSSNDSFTHSLFLVIPPVRTERVSIFRKEYLQKNNISLEKIKDNWVLSSLIPTKRIEKLIQIFISLKQTHTDVLTISQPLCCTTTVHSLGPFHGRIYVHSSPLQTTILELHPQKGAQL